MFIFLYIHHHTCVSKQTKLNHNPTYISSPKPYPNSNPNPNPNPNPDTNPNPNPNPNPSISDTFKGCPNSNPKASAAAVFPLPWGPQNRQAAPSLSWGNPHDPINTCRAFSNATILSKF